MYRDTEGMKGRNSVTKQHFKKVHGILLVYNVTDRKSFENLPKWIRHLQKVLHIHKVD